MATDEQLERLDEALFSPTEEVVDGQRRIKLRSTEDLMRARDLAERRKSGKTPVRRVRMTLADGL